MSNPTTSPGLPTSWRDVYDLVKHSSERIDAKFDTLNSQVVSLDAKFDVHMLEHAKAEGLAAGQRAGEARVVGIGRATVALVVSIMAAVGTMLSILTMVR